MYGKVNRKLYTSLLFLLLVFPFLLFSRNVYPVKPIKVCINAKTPVVITASLVITAQPIYVGNMLNFDLSPDRKKLIVIATNLFKEPQNVKLLLEGKVVELIFSYCDVVEDSIINLLFPKNALPTSSSDSKMEKGYYLENSCKNSSLITMLLSNRLQCVKKDIIFRKRGVVFYNFFRCYNKNISIVYFNAKNKLRQPVMLLLNKRRVPLLYNKEEDIGTYLFSDHLRIGVSGEDYTDSFDIDLR